MNDRYVEWQMDSWEHAVELANRLPENWIFRGQSNEEMLRTTLERYPVAPTRSPAFARRDAERDMLDEFKRQAHLVIEKVPQGMDDLDWLAMLRHHGGVTRLLDFTRSFYVGAFFAVEEAQKDSVLWAIDRRYIGKWVAESVKSGKFSDVGGCRTYQQKHQNEPRAFEAVERRLVNGYLASDSEILGVACVTPWHLNERMAVQQGVFLCPLGVNGPFEMHLCRSLDVDGNELPRKVNRSLDEIRELLGSDKPAMVKILVPHRLRLQILLDLRRMNVTAATLFPGIDGFSRSLNFLASGYRAIDVVGHNQ